MRTLIIAALLTGVVSALQAQPAAWPEPERTVFLAASSQIPIERIGGYPVVDVVVNGRSFRFGLETGGSFFGVSTRLAETLGLPLTPTNNAAGAGPSATTVVDSLRLGNVVFHNARAAVSDMFTARGWDGIISPPLLRQVLYTLDLRGNELRLEDGALPAADDRTILNISRRDRGRRIDFPLKLGDRVVHPVIDTQSQLDVIVSDSLLDVVRIAGTPVEIGQASGPSQGTFTLRGARLAVDALVGGTTLVSMPIIFRDRPGPVAGNAFLEQFVITVDDRNGRIRFTPHATPTRFSSASWERPDQRSARAAQQRSTGGYLLALRTSGTPATVVSVEPGSNVDRAGIRVGDVFLEVAGTAIQQMSPADWQRVLDGSPVRLTLMRNGQRYETLLTPVPRSGGGEQRTTAPQQEPADLRAEIEALNRRMVEAWDRNDPAAVAAFYSDDARIMGPGGAVVEGRSAVDSYWRRFPMQGRSWSLEVLEAGGTGDLAYQLGRSTIAGGGRSQTTDFIAIWRRQPNGELKLAVDYWVPSRSVPR